MAPSTASLEHFDQPAPEPRQCLIRAQRENPIPTSTVRWVHAVVRSCRRLAVEVNVHVRKPTAFMCCGHLSPIPKRDFHAIPQATRLYRKACHGAGDKTFDPRLRLLIDPAVQAKEPRVVGQYHPVNSLEELLPADRARQIQPFAVHVAPFGHSPSVCSGPEAITAV